MATDFAVDVTRWCDEQGALGDAVFRAIGEALLERVKELTPVRTGNLRANWQVVRDGEQETVERVTAGVAAAGAGIAIKAASGLGAATPAGAAVTAGASAIAGLATGDSVQTAVSGVAGSLAGTLILGAAGTAIGGPVGGLIGAAAGGFAGEAAGKAILGSGPTQKKGTSTVPPDLKLGERLVILNPVVYARAVEYGREIQRKDGTITRVAGRGMVAQAVAEAPRIAEMAARRVVGDRRR